MALVNLLTIDDIDGPAHEVAESGVAQYGQLLNTWGALLNRPEIFAAYLPFLRAVAGPGTLDPKIKDMSATLVGWLNNCRYTVSHRAASSARNGVADSDLQKVMDHDWSGFDAATQTALEFTEVLTLSPTTVTYPEAPLLVEGELRDRLKTQFTDEQIVELAMSVSVWNGLARFHRVMDFDLDMPVPPEGIDPAQPNS